MCERVAHARLRRQMDDLPDVARRRFERRGKGLMVCHIEPMERELAGFLVRRQLRKARLFEAYLVIIVEIIHPDDFIPACQQGLDDMMADEPGCTGDKDGHAASLSLRDLPRAIFFGSAAFRGSSSPRSSLPPSR